MPIAFRLTFTPIYAENQFPMSEVSYMYSQITALMEMVILVNVFFSLVLLSIIFIIIDNIRLS